MLLTKNFKGLEDIGISTCPNITDTFLKSLEGQPLHHIFLVSCPKITDSGIQCLMSLPLLNLCVLNCPQISSTIMRQLNNHFKKHSTTINLVTDIDID